MQISSDLFSHPYVNGKKQSGYVRLARDLPETYWLLKPEGRRPEGVYFR